MHTYQAQPHGGGEPPPPPPDSGGIDPGGQGTDNCTCSTEIKDDVSCSSGKRVIKSCQHCPSTNNCADDLGAAPLWVQVISDEPDGSRKSWKGSQLEDAVKIDANPATADWSVSGTSGGIDDEGYFNKYRPFARDDIENRTWLFNKNNNRIDASGTMNVWLENDLGHEELWSNHFCANGRANRAGGLPVNRYANQEIDGNNSFGNSLGGGMPNGGVSYRCKLAPGFDASLTDNPDAYCAEDYDGCIQPFRGNSLCEGGTCSKRTGYHDILFTHIDNFKWITTGGWDGAGWWDPYRSESPGLRYQGRWSATYQIYGDNFIKEFDVKIRAPLGYLCQIADARRYSPWTDDDDESGPPITKQNSGSFVESTRNKPRCTWHVDAFDDGDGNGIMLSFLISKDPNYNPNGWYKVRDATFHKKGNLIVTYPAIVDPYDSDDNGKAYPLINSGSANNAGLTTVADDTFIASGNKDQELADKRDDPDTPEDEGITGQVGKVSPKNWRLSNYDVNPPYLSNLDDYLAVLRGQKTTTPITNVNQIQGNTINIFTGGNFTLNAPLPDRGSPYVVFVDGDLTLGPGMGATVNTTGDSVALIATGNINIHSTITQIDAIMIGNGFNLASDLAIGTNSPTPLKINGNLVSNTAVQTWRRDRPDFEKPSLFVVFKPKMYLDIMPLLSLMQSGGRQIE